MHYRYRTTIDKWRNTVLAVLCLLAPLAHADGASSGAADGVRFRVTVLDDPDGKMTIDTVASPVAQPGFRVPGKTPINRGFTDVVLWARVEVFGPPGQVALLQVGYPLLDELTLFHLAANGRWRSVEGGDTQPRSPNLVEHRTPVFELPPTPGGKQTVYLRVRTQGSLQLPLRLWSAVEFFGHTSHEYLVLGAYYGVLLVMALYNLFLFGSVREISYLYYVGFIVALMLTTMALNGIASQYLWPDWVWWGNRASVLLPPIVGLFAIAFARKLLSISALSPRLDRYMRWMVVAIGVEFATALFGPYQVAASMCAVLAVVFVLVIMPAAVLGWRQGYRPAKYFLIAWTVFLFGVLLTGLLLYGLIPRTDFTVYAMQIGSGLEVVLLSFALADRINLMRTQRAQAREELMRVTSDAKKELEELVLARTAQLRDAKDSAESVARQLEEKNVLLSELASRDSLTGLYNRREFLEQLGRALQSSIRSGESLALALFDLDHFKQINDTHGHQVGDEVLRRVGKVLRVHQRAGDCSGRYGGEEFAVLFSMCNGEQAFAAAERLRTALLGIRIDVGADGQPGQFSRSAAPVRVSASFGVCTAGAAAATLSVDEIVRRADLALYEAKAAGRNQVVVYAENGADATLAQETKPA